VQGEQGNARDLDIWIGQARLIGGEVCMKTPGLRVLAGKQ